MTRDAEGRTFQHKEKLIPGFTIRYNATRLVYYEQFDDPFSAIAREKQIKAGSRKKKLALINALNPNWMDFYAE
jgi:putative endonuclease